MAGLKTIAPMKTIAAKPPVQPVAAPPPTKASGRPDTSLNRPVVFPRGPEVLGLGIKRARRGIGPEPTDFEGSLPEWVWYYVSCRMLTPKQDPRQPPFVGDHTGVLWQFQVPEMPGAARQVGSSISDFVYILGTGLLIVRIEGFYWHTSAPPATQARDAFLTATAQNEGTRVERVEDSEFMDDITGGKAGKLLAEILAGRSFVGAVSGGIAVPPRYADFGP